MATQSTTDPDREHRLIEQLELRIASANTDEKFESIISKFLAALLLKLASENARNRNLTIKICQHVNSRLKLDSSISIPVESLLKIFEETENVLVIRFSMVFIEQGLARLSPEQQLAVLPGVLQSSIPKTKDVEPAKIKMWSIAFDFLLEVLQTWSVPDHATQESLDMKQLFRLSDAQTVLLKDTISSFISYDPKEGIMWQNPPTDVQSIIEKRASSRSRVISQLAKFLFTSIFTDSQRFVPAILLSVDPNAAASGLADVMFKQCNFDLEQESSVSIMFDLFDLGRPKLQMRTLSLLSRSSKSTNRSAKLLEIVEKQLFQYGTGLEAAKLRSAVFTYLTWAVRISAALFPVKERLQSALKEFIELQGWPILTDTSTSSIDLRGKAYESIGLLAAIKNPGNPKESLVTLDMIIWLFASARCDTTKDVRASVDEALSRILNVTSFENAEDLQKLKSLLLWNVEAEHGDEDPIYYFVTENSTKHLAIRFANKCLPFDDVDARYMDIVALNAKDRREVYEEGMRGLDPYWHLANAKIAGKILESGIEFPDFVNFASRTFGSRLSASALLRHTQSLTAAVVFGRNLLIHEALRSTEFEVGAQEDWSSSLEALISNDLSARNNLQQYLAQVDDQSLIALLKHSILGMSLGSYECASVACDLISLSSNAILKQLGTDDLANAQKAALIVPVQGKATRIFGILASLATDADNLVIKALENCSNWSSAVGEAAVRVQASLLEAGFTLTRSILRGSTSPSLDLLSKCYDIALSIVIGTTDKLMRHAAYSTLGQMFLCMPPATITLTSITELVDRAVSDSKKEDEVAVTVLGRLLGFLRQQPSADENPDILGYLFSLHEVRKAEFQFALGEALATAGLGFRSSSTITEFDVDAAKDTRNIQSELFQQILEQSIKDCKATKPSLKKASAIWLLSLMQYCSDTELLAPRLKDCQTAFSRLLNDRDEIVQETGSRGLSLVYEKGDKALRDDLVRDLVQSFTGGNAKMSGTVDQDTQLFEAGALPTEGGQSVQTYKDIVSLATEMGDPSLVYRFMNLASTNAIWSSRAAFGRFGLSGVLADSSYLSENKKFYPKLFRYRFDPNPNVQRSMEDIWKALVKDPNKVIEENFDLIMEDLLKSVLSGKDWRAREASCAAISDLIQGRELEKFEHYLDEIWGVAFKVLDDVKETVRIAAMKLCRTLTGMLIRNLEVGESSNKRAMTMMQHAVPFLLARIDSGAAQEIQQYGIITLLEVIKKSPKKFLQPFAPEILERLVLSLSTLEHESINYLHLNADKYGLTAEKLDKMRVSSMNTSPVSDAIERCLESLFGAGTSNADINVSTIGEEQGATPAGQEMLYQKDVLHRLETAFKTAIGLPSKVGLSRVMITLVVRYQTGFRPHADRFVKLTRKYILDRNATISISFSTALGYLLRLASDKEVHETSRYAQKLYFESQELAHRAVAGEIVQAISKASNDVFMKFASTFLSFAYIGKHDLDSDVRDRFDPAWKDNVGGSRALNLYLAEIVGLVSKHIISSLWPIRQACCLAVADFISSMDTLSPYSETEARLLWEVMKESLSGKTWSGKEKVVAAYPNFVKKAKSIWPDAGKEMKTIAIREAKRTNAAYRPHALVALGQVASTRPDLDFDAEALEVVTDLVEELVEDGDPMDVDGGDEEQGSRIRLVDATFTAASKCVLQILTKESPREVLDQALAVLRKAHGQKSAMIDTEIYGGARQLIAQATADPSSSQPNEGGQVRMPPGARASATANRASGQPEVATYAAFWQQLVLTLFVEDRARYLSDHETLRKSRAALAMALAESGLLDESARGTLSHVLQEWVLGERSRPLKTELEKSILAMRY